jgi:DNA-binding LacI/PurR family transcriptional regulator
MGLIAAETLLRRVTASAKAPYPKEIVVEPELIVRASTSRVAKSSPRDQDKIVEMRGAV